MPRDRVPEPLRNGARALDRGLRQQDHELLPPVPRDDVRRAEAAAKDLRDAADDDVPRLVPLPVVVLLEAVDVREEQAEDVAVARRPGNLLPKSVLEIGVVVEAREAVPVHTVCQGAVRGLQLLVLPRDRLRQDPHLPEEGGALRRPRHRRGHQVQLLERLDQVVVRAGAQGRYGGLQRGIARHDDHLGTGVEPLDLLQQVDAAHPRHADVGDQQVVRPGGEPFQRLLPARHGVRLVSLFLEELRHGPPDRLLVVRHQDPRPRFIHEAPPARPGRRHPAQRSLRPAPPGSGG